MRRVALLYIFVHLGHIWLSIRDLEPYLLLHPTCYKSHIKKPWKNSTCSLQKTRVKKANLSLLLCEKVLTLRTPKKGLREVSSNLSVSRDQTNTGNRTWGLGAKEKESLGKGEEWSTVGFLRGPWQGTEVMTASPRPILRP